MVPIRKCLFGLVVLAALVGFAFSQVGVAQTPADSVKVAEAKDNFHRSVVQAAFQAQRDGKISRGDLIRLRVAMLSPAFRKHAEDLAVTQMASSGSESVGGEAVPVDVDGKIDRGNINWEAIGEFLKVLIPLIIQLMDAFSWLHGGGSVWV